MKSITALIGVLALAGFPAVYAQSPTPAVLPSTFCRYVPERADDFAWENDLTAFRTYGPALQHGAENSGIDCWPKRVNYPIIDKWYRLDHDRHISYHKEHGEGYDNYHTGKSRGCGGTALWIDGKMVLSGVYKTWKILQCEREKSVFVLTYDYDLKGRRIHEVKTITIELGKRLFKSESVFTEGGMPADVDIAVGVTTHDQKGVCTLNRAAGYAGVWEIIDQQGLGTGVVMDARRITGMQEIKSAVPDESHALFLTHTDGEGKEVHYAGYGWEKAGVITTPERWNDYLGRFAADLAPR